MCIRDRLEVLDEGRRMGWPVPRIAYYTNSSPGDTAERIYRDIYAPGKYPELWFRVGGKPLLITREEACSREVREFFQIRQSQWLSLIHIWCRKPDGMPLN